MENSPIVSIDDYPISMHHVASMLCYLIWRSEIFPLVEHQYIAEDFLPPGSIFQTPLFL